MNSKRKAVYTGKPWGIERVFGASQLDELEERLAIERVDDLAEEAGKGSLSEVEYLFGTWGLPWMDARILDQMPRLRAVFYAAGSIKGFASPELWRREIPVCSAWAANAVPVAEWSFAQIILCLKRTWPVVSHIRAKGAGAARSYANERVPGTYGSTVGLLSLGMIGQMVARRLQSLDVEVVAFDPMLPEEKAADLGVRLVSLNEVFEKADVVSCHTPWLKETEGMVRAEHFERMPSCASFINTARGAVVDEPGMVEVLGKRPDITAVLDVTWPEPPVEGSPLYTLPNVILTPHIAGSQQSECHRMLRYMIDEYDRFVAGEPLKWVISEERAKTLA